MTPHKQQMLKRISNQEGNKKLGYKAWLELVNRVLLQNRGISCTHPDLKECKFLKWFEAGVSIAEAATQGFRAITR